MRQMALSRCNIWVFASLLTVVPAAADIETIPQSQTFQFSTGGISMVSSFGFVYANGTVQDFSGGGDVLSGPFSFGAGGPMVNLAPGSTIQSAAFTVDSVSFQTFSTAPKDFAVSGFAQLEGAYMNAYCQTSGVPVTTTIPGPITIGQPYSVSLPLPCSNFSLIPGFTGNGFLLGAALHYPAYDPSQDPLGHGFIPFEMDGIAHITFNDTIRIDYTSPVPEPGGNGYRSLSAILLLFIGFRLARARRIRSDAPRSS